MTTVFYLPRRVISHQQRPLHHLLSRLDFSFSVSRHMFCLHLYRYPISLFPFDIHGCLCSVIVSAAFSFTHGFVALRLCNVPLTVVDEAALDS
jgi:hypothetical protein